MGKLDVKNLTVRTASGLIYAGLLVGAVVLGPLALAILLAVFAVGASYEMGKNAVGPDNPDRWQSTWLVDAAALVLLILSMCSFQNGLQDFELCFQLFIILVFIRFLVQIFVRQNKALYSIAVFALELLYIGVPLSMLVVIECFIPNYWIVVCVLAMIWINDSGAYLVGSLGGRHKMFPRLSPKKSWEGFLGGLLFNIGAAFIFFYCFKLQEGLFLSNVMGWVYIGMCVTAFATIGDLFESLLKRSLGIKDFGSIIPGHGGVLDRIDSILCVVPCVSLAVYLAIRMFGV